MGEGDRLYFQLVNQLNMECTLARIYREKAKRESDSVVKMLYKKLHEDSLTHSALLISAIKAIGESAPKPVVLKITSYDSSTGGREEIPINGMELELEEMEAAAAHYFSLLKDRFPEKKYSKLFHIMWKEKLLHQQMLKAIRDYKLRKEEVQGNVCNEP